jgi:PAS domain S-box-containing protein
MNWHLKSLSLMLNRKRIIITTSIISFLFIVLVILMVLANFNKRIADVFYSVSILHFIGFIAIAILFIQIFKKTKLNNQVIADEKSFKMMFEYANDPQIIVNNLIILDCNTKVCELFETSREHIIGKHIFSFSAPFQTNGLPMDKVAESLKEKVDNCEEVTFSWKCVLPSGLFIDLEVVMKRINIGSISVVVCRLRNITHELESICSLLESEARYREIVETANTVIIKFDLKGSILFYNDFAEKLLGYKSFEALGANIFDLLKPFSQPDDLIQPIDAIEWVNQIIKNYLTRPYYENWIITKPGQRLFIGWTSRPFCDINHNIIGVQSIGFDRTENKLIQNRLADNEKKFKLIFNSTSEGIIIMDFEGEVLEMNNTALQFVGLTQKEFEESKPNKDKTLKIMPQFMKMIEETIKNERIIMEMPFFSKDGRTILTEVQTRKINYNNQDVILVVGRDITERKKLQKEIISAAISAEEIERSRVAKELHDSVSPILSASKLYAQTLSDIKDPEITEKVIEKLVSTINESMRSITEISNNLSPHVLENFGLIEAINAFADRIIDSKKLAFEVTSNITDRLDNNIEFALYRVFTELVNNTMKYANATNITISIMQSDGIILTYQDNGIGFDLKKVRSSKKGMGLFNINTRIESVNGSIKIITRPGQGFRLIASIPIR